MRYLFAPAFLLLATSLPAEPIRAVVNAVNAGFTQMPDVALVDRIEEKCGASAVVDAGVAYCTSKNRIFLEKSRAQDVAMPYILAHVFAHAVHVQHGVADVALRTIRARRAEEVLLRRQVEAQADCIAGFILARAGLPLVRVLSVFDIDPLSGVHWGRDPLRIGPQITVGIRERDVWIAKGFRAVDLKACDTKDFSADLVFEAYRGP